MRPDDDEPTEDVASGSMLDGWMPVVRAICEAYHCLPNAVAQLTLDQILLLCVKKNLLAKRGEVGWSFSGTIAIMDPGKANKGNIKGANKRKDKSLFQHVMEQKRKDAQKQGKRKGRRNG